MHQLWKYKKGKNLAKLDVFLLKYFCDTPACPSCGETFIDNITGYLGVWGTENNPYVIYRVCSECGENIKSASYFELLEVERVIENYLTIVHPFIIKRIEEYARTKPIVPSRF